VISRVDTLRQLAATCGADAAILAHPPDLRWAVGFTGSNGLLLVTESAVRIVGEWRSQDRQIGATLRGIEEKFMLTCLVRREPLSTQLRKDPSDAGSLVK